MEKISAVRLKADFRSGNAEQGPPGTLRIHESIAVLVGGLIAFLIGQFVSETVSGIRRKTGHCRTHPSRPLVFHKLGLKPGLIRKFEQPIIFGERDMEKELLKNCYLYL